MSSELASRCLAWQTQLPYELALVNTPYFMGSVAFTCGAYCGVLEVINLPNEPFTWFLTSRRQLRRVRGMVDLRSMGACYANFVGSIAFNIDTLASYFDLSPWTGLVLTWGMAALGGLGFTVGGIFECQLNKVTNFEVCKPKWWLCFGNLWGGIFFLIPGVAGLFSPSEELYVWIVDFLYLLGSFSFFFASIIMLWMWKNEQYGFALLPELNSVEVPENVPAVLDFHAEYGCGRASATQLPWLLLYEVNAALAVVDLAIKVTLTMSNTEARLFNAMPSIINFLLSHGILMLGSVIHHVPTKTPFSWLLMYMRFVLLLSTMHLAWAVSEEVHELLRHPL